MASIKIDPSKRYSNKSNAARAAKAAGFTRFTVFEDADGWAIASSESLEREPKTTTRKPQTHKPAKPRKAAKPQPARKANGDRRPSGMTAQILNMAARKNGVSRAELNELTGWRGAPWKWLFSNKHKTGFCDRWRFTFRVVDGVDGVRYCVAPLSARKRDSAKPPK